jgi:hypothetical protein
MSIARQYLDPPQMLYYNRKSNNHCDTYHLGEVCYDLDRLLRALKRTQFVVFGE